MLTSEIPAYIAEAGRTVRGARYASPGTAHFDAVVAGVGLCEDAGGGDEQGCKGGEHQGRVHWDGGLMDQALRG